MLGEIIGYHRWWPSQARIFQLLNHVISLLSNNASIAERSRDFVSHMALWLLQRCRINLEVIVLGLHKILVPFKLGISRIKVIYFFCTCTVNFIEISVVWNSMIS